MKNLLIVVLATTLFMSCGQPEKRYTQQSKEIDMVKKHIENYNNKDYGLEMLSDTCKSYFNTKDDFIARKDLIAYHQANDSNYSSRGFLADDQEFEMVVTDKGHTWVNSWLNWRGTMKESGKTIDIPIHLTYQFVDGKIVREVGYWDPTEVVLDLQALEQQKMLESEMPNEPDAQ